MPVSSDLVIVPRRYLPISVVSLGALAATDIIFPPMTLGGQPVNSPFTDSDGIGWIVNQLDGWDSADVRLQDTPRGNADGSFHEPSYYGARLLVAHGSFFSIAGPQALMDAREKMHAIVDITGDKLAPFVVNEMPPKLCMVQKSPGYKDRPNGTTAFDFEIHLKANDPLKYDPVPSTVTLAANTSVSVTNVGTKASAPILTIRGPCLGFSVANTTTGQTLAFSQALSATDVFVVNLDRKSALLNGVSAIASIISDPLQWWALGSGPNVVQFATLGTGTLTVTYQSAWS
jgi:hypothetical protein